MSTNEKPKGMPASLPPTGVSSLPRTALEKKTAKKNKRAAAKSRAIEKQKSELDLLEDPVK